MKKTILTALLISLSLPVASEQYKITYGNSKIDLPDSTTSSLEMNHTFTNCSQIGRFGPSLSQCENEYSGQNILDDGFEFQVDSGVQQFIIPETGTYRIKAVGAQGGDGEPGRGGYGVFIEGEFNLQKDKTLIIVVGQKGRIGVNLDSSNGDGYGGGGGGTYVALSDKTPLVVAAGGHGGNLSYDGPSGSTSIGDGYGLESGNSKGGCSGGFLTDGNCSNKDGKAFVNGSTGGTAGGGQEDADGGFGGGSGTTFNGSGAGGGYSGGSGQDSPDKTSDGVSAKSYNDGSNTNSGTATSGGHGKVVIEFIK